MRLVRPRVPGEALGGSGAKVSPAEVWIKASFFHVLRDPRPLPVGLELRHFCAGAALHDGAKEALPLWSPATFTGERRALANVASVTALAFDVDEPFPSADAFAARLSSALDLRWYFHTSFSAQPGALKFRVLAPLSRPMLPVEHRAVWPILADVLARGGVEVDAACKDPSRAYFVAAIPPSGVFEARELPGVALDVDLWLSDARDVDTAVAEVEAFEREQATARAERRASTPRGPGLSPVERASRYLATMPPSISGAHGHDALYRAALALHGFGLAEGAALALLRAEFNPRCKPTWSERDLTRKAREVARSRFPAGYLLEGRRAT